MNKADNTSLTLSYAELDAISRFFADAYNSGTTFTKEQLLVAEKVDKFFLYYEEDSVYSEKLTELNN